MSVKSRNKAKLKRLQEKRARKEAMRKQYEGFRDHGLNTKSKRVQLRNKRRQTVRNDRHLLGECGNIGCRKCSLIEKRWLASELARIERNLRATSTRASA